MKTELGIIHSKLKTFGIENRIKSKQWLARIRRLPCVKCQANAEPHHVYGSDLSAKGSSKTSDLLTVPLCRDCHLYYEAHPTENHTLIEHIVRIFHGYIAEKIQNSEPL